MVQVVVGEQRGEGVRMGCRTFWDTDTDAYASDTFINVSGTDAPARVFALRPLADKRPRTTSRTAYFASQPRTACTCTERTVCGKAA